MNKPIRIIKRQERELLRNQVEDSANDLKSENQISREIGATIASWIEERREMSNVFTRSGGLLRPSYFHAPAGLSEAKG